MSDVKLVSTEHLKTVLPFINEKIEKTNNGLREELKNTNDNIKQSSWSQNDETQIDYIKDRTHYKYDGRTVLFPKTEVSNGLNVKGIDNILSLGIGYEVIVCCDGVEYKCTIKKTQVGQYVYIYIGNLSIYENDSRIEDTEEPFYIFIGNKDLIIYFENSETSHTIEILNTELSTQYSCLDENYIPDTIARVDDIPKELLLYKEQSLEESQLMQARRNMDLYNMDTELLLNKENVIFKGQGSYCDATFQFPELVVGETYRIEFRNTKYPIIGYATCDGDITSDEYTMIFFDNEGTILCEYTNGYLHVNIPIGMSFVYPYDVFLLKVNNINKIPCVYVPDTIARTSDIPEIDVNMSDDSENPVQNKVVKEYVDNVKSEMSVYYVDYQNPNYEEALAAYEAGRLLAVTNYTGTDTYPITATNTFYFNKANVLPTYTLLSFFGLAFVSNVGYVEVVITLMPNSILGQTYPIRQYLNTKLGGTMEAPLILAADPTEDMEAATKGYVDESITALSSSAVLTTEQSLTDEQKAKARSNISKYNWRTFSDSWGTYTYAIANDTVNYDIAQTVTNTSGNGTVNALEDIVSFILCAFTFEPSMDLLKYVSSNYDALKNAGAIKESAISYYRPNFDMDYAEYTMHISEVTSYGATHLIEVINDNFACRFYYDSVNNELKMNASKFYSVSSSLTQSGFAADAKAVGDALALKADVSSVLSTANENSATESYSPAADTDLATKEYVDDAVANAGGSSTQTAIQLITWEADD